MVILTDSERFHFTPCLANLLDSDAILSFKSAYNDDDDDSGKYALKPDDDVDDDKDDPD